MKKLSYSSQMLPGINYADLVNEYFEDDGLVDLEYETKKNLSDLVISVKEILQDANMIIVHEFMIAHLSAYLGFISVASLGLKHAKELENLLVTIIYREAKVAYELFLQFPVNSNKVELNIKNLEKIRIIAPGSIIAQTVRLGRIIHDAMEELQYNRGFQTSKQTELFAPAMPFMVLLRTKCDYLLREFKKYGDSKSILYHINQTALQIGWLIGYYSHLDNKDDLAKYIDYACPVMKIYIDSGEKYLKLPLKKMRQFIRNENR